jgi:hypothetical protein
MTNKTYIIIAVVVAIAVGIGAITYFNGWTGPVPKTPVTETK